MGWKLKSGDGPSELTDAQMARLDGEPSKGPDKVAPGGLAGVVRGNRAPSTTAPEAFGRGALQGASLGFGDEVSALADTGVSKLAGLGDKALGLFGVEPHFGRGVERLNKAGGEGAGLPLDNPDLSYSERRDAYRARNEAARQEHGGAYFGGELAGGLLAPIPGGSAVKGAKGLKAAVKAGAATGAKLGAVSGLGNSTSDLASGDAVGALRDTVNGAVLGGVTGGAIGAASEGVRKGVTGARARVIDRARQDVTTGEQNAGKKLSSKFTERAGEDDEHLAALFERHPDIYKTLATKAHGAPGKAEKAVDAKVSELGDKLDKVYEQMAAGGGAVTPTEIVTSFDKQIAAAKGDIDLRRTLGTARAQFIAEFGEEPTLPIDYLRDLKRSAARSAFAGDPAAPASLKAQASKGIWGAYSDAIERVAKGTKGVNTDELRALNQDMSVLLAAKPALAERAAMQRAGRFSIGHLMGHTGGAMAGALAGSGHGGLGATVGGAVAGLALPAAARLGARVLRRADYAVAEHPYAVAVLEGLRRGLTLPAAVEAAQASGRASAANGAEP